MDSLKDRTTEFKSAVQDYHQNHRPAQSDSKRPLLSQTAKNNAQRSEFAKMAAQIGKDIQATTFKLDKLAQLAKRKTLFDDRPVEISELTYIIKQDIAHLNQQIAALQSFIRTNLNNANGVGSKQVSEHNNNVVMMLQSKLADTSIGFKDVLEIRTQNMKASRDRTEQFMHSSSTPSNPLNPTSVLRSRTPTSTSSLPLRTDSPLYRSGSAGPQVGGANSKGKGREVPGASSDFLALDLGAPPSSAAGGQNGDGYMMQEMVMGQDTYMTQRSSAIETIESTVAELGQIFSQLATMVATQGEMVTRIDNDTEEIASNVQGAQTELLKLLSSVSSNRMLMFKVFGVLIAFFLLFILVS